MDHGRLKRAKRGETFGDWEIFGQGRRRRMVKEKEGKYLGEGKVVAGEWMDLST